MSVSYVRESVVLP